MMSLLIRPFTPDSSELESGPQWDGAEVVEPPSVMTSFDCLITGLGDA